jgi:hypothetical protein
MAGKNLDKDRLRLSEETQHADRAASDGINRTVNCQDAAARAGRRRRAARAEAGRRSSPVTFIRWKGLNWRDQLRMPLASATNLQAVLVRRMSGALALARNLQAPSLLLQ